MDFCKYSQQEDTKKKEEENRKLSRLKRLRRLKIGLINYFYRKLGKSAFTTIFSTLTAGECCRTAAVSMCK